MIWLGYYLSTDPKHDGKQNYLCRDCNRQFIGDHNLTYPRCPQE
ncbi:IS1/IS1595 family N-terminal zinc-binding domain-containing protein [Cardiobacterium valvarum]